MITEDIQGKVHKNAGRKTRAARGINIVSTVGRGTSVIAAAANRGNPAETSGCNNMVCGKGILGMYYDLNNDQKLMRNTIDPNNDDIMQNQNVCHKITSEYRNETHNSRMSGKYWNII